MGVTIHFEGKLRSAAALESVASEARALAARMNWQVREIPEAIRSLERVRDEQDWNYEGSTKGVEVLPEQNCEPLRLEFDDQCYIQEFTKTQFAPLAVHIAIVEFLYAIAPLFDDLVVLDEGEFYETGDRRLLTENIEWCNRVIAERVAENPKLRSAVRLPSGRIVDLSG